MTCDVPDIDGRKEEDLTVAMEQDGVRPYRGFFVLLPFICMEGFVFY